MQIEISRFGGFIGSAGQGGEGGVDIGVRLLGELVVLDLGGIGVVFADVGGQDVADGEAVAFGVAGDAFQGVDGGGADFSLVGAELLDGSGVPVGDLAFAGDVELILAAAQGQPSYQQSPYRGGHACGQDPGVDLPVPVLAV